jgi:glycerol-3-phosphate dehydrogenase
METNAAWGAPLHAQENIYGAQVIWAVRNEMARTVEDVLARRTRVLFIDAQAALDLAPEVASIMREELNMDESWKQKQIEIFSALASGYLLKKN